MTDSTPIQRVQFGEAIQPAKAKDEATVYSQAHKSHPGLNEKGEGEAVDVEDRAVQIANEDLNKKNKQVCGFSCPSLQDLR